MASAYTVPYFYGLSADISIFFSAHAIYKAENNTAFAALLFGNQSRRLCPVLFAGPDSAGYPAGNFGPAAVCPAALPLPRLACGNDGYHGGMLCAAWKCPVFHAVLLWKYCRKEPRLYQRCLCFYRADCSARCVPAPSHFVLQEAISFCHRRQ